MKKPALRQHLKHLFLASLLTTLLGVQSVSADSYPTMTTATAGGGSSSTIAVLAIAVGIAAVVSSVDCASGIPSLPMCQQGGSSYRTAGTMDTWGSMGSLIRFHDIVVTPSIR